MLLGECAKCGQPVTDTQLKAGRGAQLSGLILCERCAPRPDSDTIAAPAMGEATAKALLAINARTSDSRTAPPTAMPFDQAAVTYEQDPHFKEMVGPRGPSTPSLPLATATVPQEQDSTRRAPSPPSSSTRQNPSEESGHAVSSRKSALLAAGIALTAFFVTVLFYIVFIRKESPVASTRHEPVAAPALPPTSSPAVPPPLPAAKPAGVTTSTTDDPQETPRSANDSDYDPRAAVAAALLTEARAHLEKNPQDTLGYRRRLEDLVQRHLRTPAGEEAAHLLAEWKDDSGPGASTDPRPGLWVSYWTRKRDQFFISQIVSKAQPTFLLALTRGNHPDTSIPRERFCARFGGLLRVEKGGRYAFSLQADDFALVWLDGQQRSDSRRKNERAFEVELTPGDHAIRIDFFQGGGNALLNLQWIPPGTTDLRDIPPDALWYVPAQRAKYEEP